MSAVSPSLRSVGVVGDEYERSLPQGFRGEFSGARTLLIKYDMRLTMTLGSVIQYERNYSHGSHCSAIRERS